MAELRFAVVGAGFWAQYQLAAWREVPGARCIAICDRDRGRAARLAAATDTAGVYSDAAEMLDRECPDFVDIVTDIPSHASLVKLAASRKLPVICQKPLAATFAECLELIQICREAGVSLTVHENWRWQAALRSVKNLLTEQTIGEPFRCRIDWITGFDVFANQPGLRESSELIIADVGCHLIDLARSYFGEADRVYCQINRVHREILGEDAATVMLSMSGGRTTVSINMALAGTPLERECFPQTLVFIEGDRGSIEVAADFWVRHTTALGTDARRVPPPEYPWADPNYAAAQASMVPCQADILRALRDGGLPETHAGDNLRTMQIVFAAYESARSGRAVSIDAAAH